MNSLLDFHLLRPWALLLVLLAPLVWYGLKQLSSAGSDWRKVIDARLLPHLLHGEASARHGPATLAWLASAGWLLACLALAGPSWQKESQPVSRLDDTLVIILDLSFSMYAEDETPSRLVLARRKIEDILKQRREGLTALIAYAGDAHTVVPPTDDTRTIANMLPALEPAIMPVFGSNLRSALQLASELLGDQGSRHARLLLLTDELETSQLDHALQSLPEPSRLSIMTFGTPQGAPIPVDDGFLRDRSGNIIIARLNADEIRQAASRHNIPVMHNRLDNRDIAGFIATANTLQDNTTDSQRQSDIWLDNGYWLVLPLLLLLLAGFRRGWLLALLPCCLLLPQDSHALDWQALWQNDDQRAMQAFDKQQHGQAAELFRDHNWKAASLYRQGEYQKALDYFDNDTASGLFNRGNALAQLGRYQQAIDAYQQALAIDPALEDAAANKALVEQLLQQEQEQEQQQQQDQDQQQEQQAGNGQQQEQQTGQQGQQGQQDANNPPSSSDSEETGQDQPSARQGQQQDPQQDNSQPAATDSEPTQASEDPHQQAQPGQHTAQDNDSDAAVSASEPDPQTRQQQQALQQWLRSIPDEPGQLLRNKFRYQHEQNRRQQRHIDPESEKPW